MTVRSTRRAHVRLAATLNVCRCRIEPTAENKATRNRLRLQQQHNAPPFITGCCSQLFVALLAAILLLATSSRSFLLHLHPRPFSFPFSHCVVGRSVLGIAIGRLSHCSVLCALLFDCNSLTHSLAFRSFNYLVVEPVPNNGGKRNRRAA